MRKKNCKGHFARMCSVAIKYLDINSDFYFACICWLECICASAGSRCVTIVTWICLRGREMATDGKITKEVDLAQPHWRIASKNRFSLWHCFANSSKNSWDINVAPLHPSVHKMSKEIAFWIGTVERARVPTYRLCVSLDAFVWHCSKLEKKKKERTLRSVHGCGIVDQSWRHSVSSVCVCSGIAANTS